MRACATKGFDRFLAASKADIVGIQEVRAFPQQLDAKTRSPRGWHTHFVAGERAGYGHSSMLEGFPAHFQQQSLLRVHALGLARSDAEVPNEASAPASNDAGEAPSAAADADSAPDEAEPLTPIARAALMHLRYDAAPAPSDPSNRWADDEILSVTDEVIQPTPDVASEMAKRFVRGVIDSEDMPLNISREMLQNNPQLAQIRKAVTGRVISELESLGDKEPEAFSKIWDAFGPVIKEGIWEDFERREKLLALAQAANDRMKFEHTFMISALSGDGVDDLRKTLATMVPPGPFHYPEDQMSDAPLRHLAAEITREKIYRHLHQELPYQSTVETDSWTERNNKSVRIEQTIFVERESQRKIVLGKGGATIKSIGADSRKEIAEILGVPVHLFLFVKVRENWGDDPDRYREMGLEFPKE